MPEAIYTDIAFAANQELRARKLLKITLWVVALQSTAWAIGIPFVASNGQAAMAVNGTIAMLSFAALRWYPRIPLRTLAHFAFWVGLVYIWFLQLKVEGLSPSALGSVNLWFIVLMLGTMLLFMHGSRRTLVAYVGLCFLSFFLCVSGLLASAPVLRMDAGSLAMARAMTFLSVFVTATLLTFAWSREVLDAGEKLTAANNRMEALLENMLPRSISDRLRQEGAAFADGIAECSVMFVDIVGFTRLAASMPPDELVRLLDEIFSHFDELTANARLEKIKTIGDAYMVAAGIPEPRADHAQSLVRLAMEMQATIRRYGLHIRCGINSGKVVAGVIGKKKFIYDLWGDTVNVASRMESEGIADEIQVSECTAQLIQGEFHLTRRDKILIKGKGKMPVFLVAGVNFQPKNLHSQIAVSTRPATPSSATSHA